ncbi:hypothetical protein VNO77_43883 [Canavalia gladiata]|uniref:Uncharacterized protein n=1 Tax=Canavalia gladiata TaxID=3824 RepID=A0AAN9JX73_CANGL
MHKICDIVEVTICHILFDHVDSYKSYGGGINVPNDDDEAYYLSLIDDSDGDGHDDDDDNNNNDDDEYRMVSLDGSIGGSSFYVSSLSHGTFVQRRD